MRISYMIQPKEDDKILHRINTMNKRLLELQQDELYFYNKSINELNGGARVIVDGREMEMYASYSYLGLIGHPRINQAARIAIEKYGTGTHGVRTLAGSLPIHYELEESIANFKHTESAITFSSGYVTNLSTVSTLLGRDDYAISDKLNHASIVDGCIMSGAKFVRFKHNDMDSLEMQMKQIPESATKLIVSDAVFSMDGDITYLPRLFEISRKLSAWLMIDEAHSIGVLGKTGSGIEEHFGTDNVFDLNMGTLSKTIPSVGGYIAGKKDLIQYLRHTSRAYIFSAALPPAQAAAANEAFKVIIDEPWRIENLSINTKIFINGLKDRGLNTMNTKTAIVPILCGDDASAYKMTKYSQEHGIFVLPVVSPAVQSGLARLRATISSAHNPSDIERAMDIIKAAGKEYGLI